MIKQTMSSVNVEKTPQGKTEVHPRNLMDKFLGAVIKTLFVVGSAALVLDSARNSWTWYLGKFWGDVGSAWQEMWTNLLEWVNLC